jgi:hypothetical protein
VLPKRVTSTLGRDLPKAYAVATRVVVYGIATAAFLLLLVPFLRFRAAQPTACDENPAACIDSKTGILQGAGSKIPCKYVGEWSSRRKGAPMFRITLKDDGTYHMVAGETRLSRERYTGYWAVQGADMVWRHDAAGAPARDVNRIVPESDTRFALIEENGSRTDFELIQQTKSARCTP